MSEYQYIEFQAVDAPVIEDNMEFMYKQSSRATITPWYFQNEYNFGDFHGNSTEMLRRGYDIYFHYADFGIRQLTFALPEGLPWSKKVFDKYCGDEMLTWKKFNRIPNGILSFCPEADGGSYDELIEFGLITSKLPALRDMLIAGDLRPLFLFWLACSWGDDPVPPIPAGLEERNGALEALAEFYEISETLLQTASRLCEASIPSGADLRYETWLKSQKKPALAKIVQDLLTDDPKAVQRKLMTEIRGENSTSLWPCSEVEMTFEQLHNLAYKK